MPNHLGTKAAQFHFSGTETCLSPQTNVCLQRNSAASGPRATMSKRPLCLGAEKQSHYPTPTPLCSQAQSHGARRGRAPIPLRHVLSGRRAHTNLPHAQKSPPAEKPKLAGGNQPRKEETKWLNLIFILFSPLSLLSLLLHIAENKGSSKAKSIS